LSKEIQHNSLFQQVAVLLKNAQQQVLRTVNSTMVYTYFEIGRMIVEEEQNGKERAEYGKKILKGLSEQLTKEFGKGFSVDNLQNMRKFYLTYSNYETLSSISEDLKIKAETISTELINSKAQSLI
jgi:predicted GNAT family N-acyltransferase